MFGQQQNRFTFGAANNNSTGFGTQTQASTSFGGFGAQKPTTGLFGSPATQPTNTFGGGLFGSTATANTGNNLFGGSQATTATGGLFGQNTGNSFLKPQAATTPFGTTAGFGGTTGGGLFGSTAQQQTQPAQPTGGLFGSTTGTTGLFGQPAASTGSSLFNTSSGFSGAAAPTGTCTVKFQPADGSDSMVRNGTTQTVKTKHYCISGMKQYENKSLEELRLEDYTAGIKGPRAGTASAAPATGGLFGSTQPASTGFTTGLFGSTTNPASTIPATGSLGFNLGGQQQQATNQSAFSFGKPAGTGLFSASTAAPAQTGGIFGQPATSTTGGLFGSNNTTTGTNLFGSAAAKPGGLFGTSTSAAQPLFGTNTATTGFGQTSAQPTNLFGTKPAGFGTTTNTQGFTGFGSNNAATGGLFGAKPATATGFAQPVTANTGFSGFGQPAAGTGFGFNVAAPSTTSLFPFSNTTSNTGLFPASTAQTSQPNAPIQLTSNTDLQSQQAQIQQQILALTNSPYGDSPLFRSVLKESKTRSDVIPTDPVKQKALLNSGSKTKVNIGPFAKVKLTNIKAIGPSSNQKNDLFDGLDNEFTPETSRRSVKKLILKSSPSVNSSSRNTTADHQSVFSSTSLNGVVRKANRTNNDLEDADDENTFRLSGLNRTHIIQPSSAHSQLDDTIAQMTTRPMKSSPKPSLGVLSPVNGEDTKATITPPDNGLRLPVRLHVSKQEAADVSSLSSPDNLESSAREQEPHPCGIVCGRPDYYTVPSLEELPDYLVTNGDCMVENFTVGREGYGSLFFPGVTNVSNLNIDATVHFRRKEVTVYPDDEHKPPEGQGLNKRAEVTLDCVWPNDKSTHSPIKSPERLKVLSYRDKLEQATAKLGAKFIDYRPETGSWVFEVRHFSKYGLLDDDSDEDNMQTDEENVQKLKTLQQQNINIQKMPVQNVQGEVLSKTYSVAGVAGAYALNNLSNADNELDDQENRAPVSLANITRSNITQSLLVDDLGEDGMSERLPASHQLAMQCGVDSSKVQRLKASFLDDDELWDGNRYPGKSFQPLLTSRDSPTKSVFKKTRMADAPSPLPQSPLLRSTFRTLSPTKYFEQSIVSDVKKEIEEKSILSSSFKQTGRLSSEVKPPEPEYLLLPSVVDHVKKPLNRIQCSGVLSDITPLQNSLLSRLSKQSLDAGCLAGRRARVSWAPGNVLAHNGCTSLYMSDPGKTHTKKTGYSILSPGVSKRKSSYQVALEPVDSKSHSHKFDELILETRRKALQIQLKNSTLTEATDSSCHKYSPNAGITALHEYGKESLNDLDAILSSQCNADVESVYRESALIWELMVALWGSLPEFDQLDDIDTNSYLYENARREAFSRWLMYAANHNVEKETSAQAKKKNGVLSAIFSHLTAKQVAEAATLALESKDFRLALLLSQAGTSQSVKNMIHKQLSDWLYTQADKYIDAERLKLYSLLAGCMVWESTSSLINCCMDLDWKRSLALHYWYSQSKLNIQSAMARYDVAWKGDESMEPYAAPPMHEMHEAAGRDNPSLYDTCYHLIKLYCNRTHSLVHTLAPSAYTDDPFDYHNSWHLMQVLDALGYTHLEDSQKAFIHTRYAAQLEACGLWHWAVFILLHLDCNFSREKLIKELLLRHIELDPDDYDDESVFEENDYKKKEYFVANDLKIPVIWLHEAKAIKARCEELYEMEAWHLIYSRQTNVAHKLILNKIAPKAITSGDYDLLQSYLEPLSEVSDSITDWSTGGKIYWDFLCIKELIEDMKESASAGDSYAVEAIRPKVLSLSRYLLALSAPTALHHQARSILAVSVADFIRYIMLLEKDYLITDTDVVSSKYLVDPLSLLPLQSNDAVSLLRETMSSFMIEH